MRGTSMNTVAVGDRGTRVAWDVELIQGLESVVLLDLGEDLDSPREGYVRGNVVCMVEVSYSILEHATREWFEWGNCMLVDGDAFFYGRLIREGRRVFFEGICHEPPRVVIYEDLE